MEEFKEKIINSKLGEALRIDINGVPQYGSHHQIKKFRDVCTGFDMKEIIKQKFKNLSSGEIRTIVNYINKKPLG
jgi:hypothetical protein